MAKRLFVGNLTYEADSAKLRDIFAAVGTVVSADVISNKYTGRSKGFGFVEMSSDEEADKAIAELNGKDVDGRAMVVNEAKPREDRPAGDGGAPQGGAGDDSAASDDTQATGSDDAPAVPSDDGVVDEAPAEEAADQEEKTS